MNDPTSNPYESRPTPDGYLTYQITLFRST